MILKLNYKGLGYSFDIVTSKDAMEALQKADEMYAKLLPSTTYGKAVKQDYDTIFQEYLRLSAEEVRGEKFGKEIGIL